MNKFNTLYNHIITQARIDQFEPRLKKFKVKYPDFDVDKTLKDLLALPSKESKLACTLIVNELITGVDDKKFEMYKDDILNSDVDVSNVKQILDHIKQRGTKNYNNQIQSIYDNLQKRFDCLTNKQELDNKIVIYTIKDNRAAMRQIRQIVDAFSPNEKSIWCIIRRQNNGDMDQGWSNWIKYNAYPKQIAFQNGKLLAFNANQSKDNLWWDVKNLQSNTLKDLYGKPVKTKQSKPYDDNKRTELTIKQLQQLQKDQNGVYRTNGDFSITNDCVVDGNLPIKLSYVGRNFNINGCISLTSTETFPKKVGGEVSCKQCDAIPFRQLKAWLNSCK